VAGAAGAGRAGFDERRRLAGTLGCTGKIEPAGCGLSRGAGCGAFPRSHRRHVWQARDILAVVGAKQLVAYLRGRAAFHHHSAVCQVATLSDCRSGESWHRRANAPDDHIFAYIVDSQPIHIRPLKG
jgi:hypothetical protein